MPRRIVRRERTEEDERPEAVEEPEEETPRRGRVPRASKAYDEAPVSDDDDDEDDRPARGGKADTVRGGWDGYKRTKELGGDFPDEFRTSDEDILIKFLEDEPFANYRQHWIERPGKKSWTCLGDKCPLCEIGDRPALKSCFNILSFEADDEPVNKVWIVGSRIATQLQNFATDKKTGPLTRLYWAVKKTGKKGNATTSIVPVKERDLKEDWGIVPLDDEEIAAATKQSFDDAAIQRHTRKQLRDIADELSDEE